MSQTDPTHLGRQKAPEVIPGYRLELIIGKGGMGEVHKATQLSLGRTVAIKFLSSELAADESFVARFEKEAAALAALSHPNIVSIVDKGSDGTKYFLVMEFIDGPSLRELIGAVDVPRALRIALEICRGIEHAHGRGVIHRDLKPENILLDQASGRPKVTDFGLATFAEGGQRFALTETHVSMGTRQYMAPEQQVDARSADGRADIYALGMILYELLATKLPQGNFDPLSTVKPGLDPKLDAIVARCLKPLPDDRYQTMSALIADLAPLVEGSQIEPAQPVSALQRAGRVARRAARTAARIAEAALIACALLAVTGAAVRMNQPVRAPNALTVEALAADLALGDALELPRRIDELDNGKRLVLGEGSDTILIRSAGLQGALEGEELVLGRQGLTAGRLSPEVADLSGNALVLTARVSPPKREPRTFDTIRDFVKPPERPRAALMVHGGPSQYLAIVVPETGEPLALEWSAGSRRGAVLGPQVADEPLQLELTVDREGEARASILNGRKRTPIGEPVNLGPKWADVLGGALRPAAACHGGVCRFGKLTYELRRVEPEPPPAVAQREPSPPPRASVVPAKATPPKPAAKPTSRTTRPAKKTSGRKSR